MINPEFPIVELIDRYAICIVKNKRTHNANAEEFYFYKQQLNKFDLTKIEDCLENLIRIHEEIWDLEKELKSGKEHLLSLEIIGLRAIDIRNKNNQRVALKNRIAKLLGCSIREIKIDHLSE